MEKMAPAGRDLRPARIGYRRFSSLAGDLAAEAADQAGGGIEPAPFMTPAGRLAVLSNLLGVALGQVDQALGHKDTTEADEQGQQADVDPGEGHGNHSGYRGK